MQALRGAAARLATVQRALPLLPAWALPALHSASVAGCSALACRAGAPRSLFGCAGTLLPPAAGASFAQRPAAAPGTPPDGARGIITVPVDNNNIDKAMRRLKRRLIEEGIVKELKERQHYTKPSQQRVRATSQAFNPKALVRSAAGPPAGLHALKALCASRA